MGVIPPPRGQHGGLPVELRGPTEWRVQRGEFGMAEAPGLFKARSCMGEGEKVHVRAPGFWWDHLRLDRWSPPLKFWEWNRDTRCQAMMGDFGGLAQPEWNSRINTRASSRDTRKVSSLVKASHLRVKPTADLPKQSLKPSLNEICNLELDTHQVREVWEIPEALHSSAITNDKPRPHTVK